VHDAEVRIHHTSRSGGHPLALFDHEVVAVFSDIFEVAPGAVGREDLYQFVKELPDQLFLECLQERTELLREQNTLLVSHLVRFA